jgi:hypothetical protein
MPDFKRMKRRFYMFSLIVLLLRISASAQEDWKLVKEEVGIKVYTKTETGSEYKAFKGEMEINCKIENVVEVLKNMDSINSWVVNCEGIKLLKTEDNDLYYYIETALPWPFNHRDMVYRFQYKEVNSEQVRVIVTGIPDYIPPRKGIVRMVKTDGYWLLTSTDTSRTTITYQMHVEPGGLIPAWLANTFITNVPFSTFKELRNIVQKSK